jgi:hypothetical protein
VGSGWFDPLGGTDCEEGQLKVRAALGGGSVPCHASEWVVYLPR